MILGLLSISSNSSSGLGAIRPFPPSVLSASITGSPPAAVRSRSSTMRLEASRAEEEGGEKGRLVMVLVSDVAEDLDKS